MTSIDLRLGDLWRQWTLAIGRAGMLWASAAAVVGLLCCVVSLVTMASSLRMSEIRRSQDAEAKVFAFEKVNHLVMKAINGLAVGRIVPKQGEAPVSDAWNAYSTALRGICDELSPSIPGIDRLRRTCDPKDGFNEQMASAIARFDPPRSQFDPAAMREFQDIRDEVITLREFATRQTDELQERLVSSYGQVMLVLTVSAIGFAGSGLVLLMLVGRASMRHFAKEQEAAAAARAATEARDLLKETIESLPAGLIVYDSDERLMLFNAMAAEISPVLLRDDAIGMTYEQIVRELAKLGAGLGVVVLESDIADWIARFRAKDVPYAHQMPDGRWFEWTGRTTPSGKTVGLRVDVTAAKRQELALQRSHDRYQSLVDSLSDTVYALDAEGRFTFASPSALSLLGVAPDLLVGMRFTDFVPREDVAKALEDGHVFHSSSNQEVRQRSLRIRTVDGEIRHVEVRYRKPIGVESEATVQIGVMRDVTVRVRMTQRLAAERNRLRAVVESSTAMIVLTDRDLRVQMANGEFWKGRGLVASESIGRPLTELVPCGLDPAILARWRCGTLSAEQSKPVHYTSKYAAPDGRPRVLNVTARPIVGHDRTMQQVIFLGVDDTERREAEQAMFDADRMATLGEMAATVAHELRQPLQVMTLACGSALEEVSDAAAQAIPVDGAFVVQKLERINAQIGRADRIIGDLRIYARGAAGDAEVAFDPATAVQGAIDMTSAGARQARMKVSMVLGENLPSLNGHVGKLEQVLINLINNARDAGGHIVDVSAVSQLDGGRPMVCIGVADDGPGIPAHVLPRLFHSFVTTKPSGKGTGLGLRICRRIVEEMGGSISAANRPEGGARFEILLPGSCSLHALAAA